MVCLRSVSAATRHRHHHHHCRHQMSWSPHVAIVVAAWSDGLSFGMSGTRMSHQRECTKNRQAFAYHLRYGQLRYEPIRHLGWVDFLHRVFFLPFKIVSAAKWSHGFGRDWTYLAQASHARGAGLLRFVLGSPRLLRCCSDSIQFPLWREE